MSQALASYDRLIAAHFSDAQARAILDAMAGDLVTREYLDSRLEALEHRLIGTITTRMLQVAALAIVLGGVVSGLVDRLVRP